MPLPRILELLAGGATHLAIRNDLQVFMDDGW